MANGDQRAMYRLFLESVSAISASFQRHKRLIVLNLAGLFAALVLLAVVGQVRFSSTLYFYSDINADGRFGTGAMTVVSGMCLFVGGALLISSARIQHLRRAGALAAGGHRWWLLIAGAGLVFLGFDEILMIHEYLTLKMAQFGVPKLFGIDQDIYIFAVYGIVAFAVLFNMLPSIYEHRGAVFPLAASIVFFALTQVVDVIPWDGLSGSQKTILGPAEEIFKTMGAWSAALYAELFLESVVMSDVRAGFRPEG